MKRAGYRWWLFKRRASRRLRNPVASLPVVLLGLAGVSVALLLATVVWKDTTRVQVEQARLALKSGRPDLALRLAESVLEEHPRHADALHTQAEALTQLGGLEQSRLVLAYLIAGDPDRTEHRASLVRWVYARLDETLASPAFAADPGLQRRFQTTLTVGEEQADWFAERTDQYWRTEGLFIRACLTEARARARQAVLTASDNDPTAARPAAAHDAETAALLDQADILLNDVLAERPDHFAAWALRLDLLARRNDVPRLMKAIHSLGSIEALPASLVETAVAKLGNGRGALDPVRASSLAWRLLEAVPVEERATTPWRVTAARLHLLNDEPDQAAEPLRQVLAYEPQHREARSLLARTLARLGRPGEAADLLDGLLGETPGSIALNARYARATLQAGWPGQAATRLRAALALNGPDPGLIALLIRACLETGNLVEAEQQLYALVQLQPHDARVYSWLGHFYAARGNGAAGLAVLQDLEETNRIGALLAQGRLLRMVRRPQQALIRLQQGCEQAIAERDPLALAVTHELAALHFDRGDRDAARAVYEPLIAADLFAPQAALAQLELAGPGHVPAGAVERLAAISQQLDSDDHPARYALIRGYVRIGQIDRAMALLDEWITAEADPVSLLRAKGELFLEAGRPLEAAVAFEQATELASDNATVWQRLARARFAAFDFRGVEAALRHEGTDGNARFDASVALAHVFQRIGLTEQAQATYDEMVEAGVPHNPAALLNAGQLAARLDESEARRFLERISPATAQYGPAQLWLAHLDLNEGLDHAAKTRLAELLADARHRGAAVHELVTVAPSDLRETVFGVADTLVHPESLPGELANAWRRCQVAAALRRGDWAVAEQALDELAAAGEAAEGVDAARMALAVHLGQLETADRLLEARRGWADDDLALLAATITGSHAGECPGAGALPRFLHALATSNLPAARATVAILEANEFFHRKDMYGMLDGIAGNAPQTAPAARRLATALLAAQAGLPELAVEITGDLIRRQPTLTAAAALHAQTRINLAGRQNADTLTKPALWQSLIEDTPTATCLAQYLGAQEAAARRDHDSALEVLQALHDREPDNSVIQCRLAQVLVQAGRPETAISLFERLWKQPSSPRTVVTNTAAMLPQPAAGQALAATVANELACLLARHWPDRLDEARRIAEAGLKHCPRHAALLDTLGWIEYLGDRPQQALACLNRAVVGAADVPEVHWHLGQVYLAAGDTRWARYHLEQAAGADPTAAVAAQARALLKRIEDRQPDGSTPLTEAAVASAGS